MKKMLAQFSNIEQTTTVTVYDDISYEVKRNDYTQRFDMTKWYVTNDAILRHVKNDIKDGAWSNWGELFEVVLEAK